MSSNLKELKRNLLSTEYPKWRRGVSSAFLILFSYLAVFTFGYTYFSEPQAHCWKGFFYLSILWLIVQTLVISYLFFFEIIPAFARWSIELLLLVANAWFILFLFSLEACS
jgi:hypothetical protein